MTRKWCFGFGEVRGTSLQCVDDMLPSLKGQRDIPPQNLLLDEKDSGESLNWLNSSAGPNTVSPLKVQ